MKDVLSASGNFASSVIWPAGVPLTAMVFSPLRIMSISLVTFGFGSNFKSYFPSKYWYPSAGVKGTAWAYEPEITAMAYLLETTIAIFSRTSRRKGNHWQFYRPSPGMPLSDPVVMLVNLNHFHFEPVLYYNAP